MNQTGYENSRNYQIQVVTLIQHQIIFNNLQGNVQQLEGRIENQILEVKRLTVLFGSILKCQWDF